MSAQPNSDIEITGCDLRLLVQKAYELSRPQGLGFMHAKPGPLSDQEVDSILSRSHVGRPVSMDYVNGRAVKLNVRRDADGRLWIRPNWYDHTRMQLSELLHAIGIKHPNDSTA